MGTGGPEKGEHSMEDVLAQSPLFGQMDPDVRARVSSLAHIQQVEKDAFLTLYGDVWPYLMLVLEGTFDAIKESLEGRSLLVISLTEGEVFWGLAFFEQDAVMPASLQAARAGRVAIWSRRDLHPILIDQPQALWELCRLMVVRMQRASNIVEGLAFQPVAGRVARLLLDQYRRAGGEAVARDLTLDEMAARVGTTREMVCRVLYRFSDQQLIRITRTEFSLTNESGLSQIAGRS
jgi:CRP-like cAMP-binding protein